MADPARIESAVKRARDQRAFIQDLLIDALGWDIDERAEDIEEISFEWSADELRAEGLEKHLVDGTIRQIRPMAGNPWGIFILEFNRPDVFATGRGMTGPLRKVLRGLVPSKKKKSSLASFGRENLLFICNHDYQHYRFVHFKAPGQDSRTAPLAAFGWGPGDPIRTLCEYNLNALEWPDGSPDAQGWINAWSQAFDVEKVTKRFYADYAAVFAKVETLIGEHNGLAGDDLRMFTQTLFNRLMFLRFIERKRWLTFDGHHDYLRALYAAGGYRGKSFYQGRLRPLFFEGMSIEGKQESEAYGRVPCLNGGLFEPAELDNRVPDLPDEVFAGILADERAGGLFYRYNFTVEESTPLDIEVAVDPEMLGKVFEELVTGRHESGSYYTPRPVVSFMCREALKGYLSGKVANVAGTRRVPSSRRAPSKPTTDPTATDPARTDNPLHSAIAALVDQQDAGKLRETHAREIVAALDDLKAVDPACGSGAYLLGLLQEMVGLYRMLFTEKLAKDARSLYDLKLRIISQSLYGVDIDPFATNIAKLRLWLSLAVEADEPVPLPNLDFKIETGDSLLAPDPQQTPDLLRGLLQASADVLAMVKNQFFLAHGEEKEEYRHTIMSEETRLRQELATEYGEGVVDWRIQFAEVFARDRGGFDIVLANPPYVRQELIAALKPQLRQNFTSVYNGLADLYVYFYARAVQLLREGGVLSFISPNKFFRSGYGKHLRRQLANATWLRVLIDFSDYPIFQAITYPAILVAQKAKPVSDTSCPMVSVYNWQAADSPKHIAGIITAKAARMGQHNLTADGWHIQDARHHALLVKLRSAGVPLADLVQGRFYRGLVTGCNAAFEVDEATRRRLVDDNPHVENMILPWIRGRNIQRWRINWDRKYLIYCPWDIDIHNYPAILDHLSHFRKQLAARPECRAGRFKWWCLSRYASDYFHEYKNPKIIYQVIATYQQFAYTHHTYVTNDKTWIIPGPPEGLIGILNSSIAWYFLERTAPKLQGGAFELRSPYMGQIPIVAPTRDLISKVAAIQELATAGSANVHAAHTLETDIDEIVARMYGLSRDDLSLMNEALALDDNRFPMRARQGDGVVD